MSVFCMLFGFVVGPASAATAATNDCDCTALYISDLIFRHTALSECRDAAAQLPA
ncbi:hypothetical protein P6P90_12805 [Ectobacillus antri]|uniref:Phospholipase n=1 Tax=Ectobacillus antri TaxID=2486280 RepID=A0ABT6H708_9BACI|nr:hypothetical protein [Ectobacillus antri]MDG4657770.1 hypothetical protein [Ectobacillus antri]MDG5754840.1 hypothetical protein [Ectobacillus antri]